MNANDIDAMPAGPEMERAMRIWDTEYALTNGIVERVTHDVQFKDNGAIFCQCEGRGLYLRKGQWHSSLESAATEARRMRDGRIESLRKQIARLEKLTFTNAREL